MESHVLKALELLGLSDVLGEPHFLDSDEVVSDGLLLGKSLLLKSGFFVSQSLGLLGELSLSLFLGSLFGSKLLFFRLLLILSSLDLSSVGEELFPAEFVVFRLLVDADGVDVLLEDLLELIVFQDLFSGVDGHLDFSLLESPVWIFWVIIVVNGAIGVLIGQPEREESDDDLVDLPCWVPRLLMEVGDGKADTVSLGGHPSVFGEEFDVWSLGWVVLWASDFTKVISTSELLWLFESENDVVPRVDILRVWKTHEVVSDLSVLLDLGVQIFLSHSGFSVKSHLTGVFHFVVVVFKLNSNLINYRAIIAI